MRKTMLVWGVVAMLSGSAAFAQDIAGNWQGTLKAGPLALRLIVQISKSEGAGWNATVYSIDQTKNPIPVNSVTLDGSNFKLTVDAVRATYEGQLAADGNSISGTWSQGAALPLELRRTTKETAWQIDPASQQAGEDWRLAIQHKLLTQFKLTKATADKSTIVAPGTVIVLRKDDLRLFTLEHKYPPGNTYANGVIKQSFLGKTTPEGAGRTFVAGEKLWLTKILFEAKGDGVELEFLSDPFGDVRYWGRLKFPFQKGSSPTPDDFAKTVAQVMTADDASAAAPAPAPLVPQAAAAPEPPPPAPSVAPVEQAPPPIAPPPPPADQPPPTVSLGQTKDEVTANFGQPTRIANLGTKQILYYKDFKVTLVNGKVTDVQ